MFQILCAFVLDVLAAAECLLAFEPWGHVDHTGVACGCCSSDRTGAYVHEIAFNPPTSICDWLTSVTRGGGVACAPPISVVEHADAN